MNGRISGHSCGGASVRRAFFSRQETLLLVGFWSRNGLPDRFQVVDEPLHVLMTRLISRRTKDRGWMHGGGDEWREIGLHELRALHGDAELRTNHCLRCRRSEADDRARLDVCYPRFRPGPAGCALGSVRLFVEATFAARLPLEVLDDVGDVDGGPVNPRL